MCCDVRYQLEDTRNIHYSTIITMKMKLEIVYLFLANCFALSLCQSYDLRVYKSLLPGPQFPIGGLPLFDEHIKGQLILRHRFVLKFQLRCMLMGAQCDIIGKWLKRKYKSTSLSKILLKKYYNYVE